MSTTNLEEINVIYRYNLNMDTKPQEENASAEAKKENVAELALKNMNDSIELFLNGMKIMFSSKELSPIFVSISQLYFEIVDEMYSAKHFVATLVHLFPELAEAAGDKDKIVKIFVDHLEKETVKDVILVDKVKTLVENSK